MFDVDEIAQQLTMIGNNPAVVKRVLNEASRVVKTKLAAPLLGIAVCIVLVLLANIIALISSMHAYRMTAKPSAKTTAKEEDAKRASAHSASGTAWTSVLLVGTGSTLGIAGCVVAIALQIRRVVQSSGGFGNMM